MHFLFHIYIIYVSLKVFLGMMMKHSGTNRKTYTNPLYTHRCKMWVYIFVYIQCLCLFVCLWRTLSFLINLSSIPLSLSFTEFRIVVAVVVIILNTWKIWFVLRFFSFHIIILFIYFSMIRFYMCVCVFSFQRYFREYCKQPNQIELILFSLESFNLFSY